MRLSDDQTSRHKSAIPSSSSQLKLISDHSKRPEATQKLNADVPGTLADLSTKYNFVLVYISTGSVGDNAHPHRLISNYLRTDYVFDGRSPPYEVDAETNPLNFYGKSKREGEIAVLRTRSDAQASGQRIVLRVPVLYAPFPLPVPLSSSRALIWSDTVQPRRTPTLPSTSS